MKILETVPGHILWQRRRRAEKRYVRSLEKLKARGVINSEGLLDIDGSVDINDFSYDNGIKSLASVGIRFGTVTGEFKLNLDVVSLEGCPKFCKSFYCHSDRLKNLKGGPEEVKLDYCCWNFHGKGALESLEGLPKTVRNLYCFGNPKLAGTKKPSCVRGEFKCDSRKPGKKKYLPVFDAMQYGMCYCGA